jgi:hypothetical protein
MKLAPDPRLIVATRRGDRWHAFGGQHIYTFKTYRNAVRRAELENGVVLQLDLSLLPMVDRSDIVTSGTSFTPRAFAERQFTLWAEREQKLAAMERGR